MLVGPCIAGHLVPEHWEALLGDLAKELVKRLGARDVEDAARQVFHYPWLLHTALCHPPVAVEGRRGWEWTAFCTTGRTPSGAGVRFPLAQVDARLQLRIYIGPCALWSLKTEDVMLNWRKHAPDLYPAYSRWDGRYPHAYFRDAFPAAAFEAADRLGIAGLASARCGDGRRKCTAVAAWVYWLTHKRMPQIDAQLGLLTNFSLYEPQTRLAQRTVSQAQGASAVG